MQGTTHRRLPPTLWLGLLSATLLAACGGSTATPAGAAATNTAGTKPNVVIMFADDLGYGDLGSFGHPYIRTPNIDTLAAEGQRWTDFYVAAPVCSPSRAALLTGRLPVRSGLYGNAIRVFFPDEPGGFPESEVTLAEALKEHGYATGMFGKWHLGDAPHALPTRHGFDEWVGVPYSNDMNWVGEPDFEALVKLNMSGDLEQRAAIYARRAAKYAAPQKEHFEAPLFFSKVTSDGFEDSVEQPTDQTLLTQRATSAAIDFIQRHADEPFFLYLPYSMPHTPLFRSEAFAGRSLGGRYGDVVEEIDASVGAVRDALAQADVLENTLIVFTSDNGPWLTYAPEHAGTAKPLRGGKGQTFEGGMRVMTFFSGPDIEPGRVTELGMDTDIYNTFMGLAGLESQATAVDSYDLSATLISQTPSPRKFVPFFRNSTLRAFRYQDHKLHFITNQVFLGPTTTHQPPLLIDLKNDIGETTDIAGQHPETLAEIQRQVAQFRLATPIAPSIFDLQKGPQQ